MGSDLTDVYSDKLTAHCFLYINVGCRDIESVSVFTGSGFFYFSGCFLFLALREMVLTGGFLYVKRRKILSQKGVSF